MQGVPRYEIGAFLLSSRRSLSYLGHFLGCLLGSFLGHFLFPKKFPKKYPRKLPKIFQGDIQYCPQNSYKILRASC